MITDKTELDNLSIINSIEEYFTSKNIPKNCFCVLDTVGKFFINVYENYDAIDGDIDGIKIGRLFIEDNNKLTIKGILGDYIFVLDLNHINIIIKADSSICGKVLVLKDKIGKFEIVIKK